VSFLEWGIKSLSLQSITFLRLEFSREQFLIANRGFESLVYGHPLPFLISAEKVGSPPPWCRCYTDCRATCDRFLWLGLTNWRFRFRRQVSHLFACVVGVVFLTCRCNPGSGRNPGRFRIVLCVPRASRRCIPDTAPGRLRTPRKSSRLSVPCEPEVRCRKRGTRACGCRSAWCARSGPSLGHPRRA